MSDDKEEGFNFATLRFLRSWVDQLIYCKNHMELDPKYKNGTKLIGSFRVTHSYSNSKSWNYCGYYTELPEIISHYLLLNLSFVKPNDDFNGKLGCYNRTHSTGPIKMIVDNEIDYITNEVLIRDTIWQPNLYQMSSALLDSYDINFLIRKQAIKPSIYDYFKVFNFLTWFLIFISIVLVSCVQVLTISNFGKFKTKFLFKLIFDNLNFLLNKPSYLLPKLSSRHYIMYFIPILCFFIVCLFENMIYSNMIIPQKHWCHDINCFAQSKFEFYAASDDPALNAVKEKTDWQFKIIQSRLTVGPPKSKINSFYLINNN